jgi:general secretion pathway protein J
LRPGAQRRFTPGFSLLEVLVAATLLAGVGLVMASMYRLSIHGQETVRDMQHRLHEGRVAMNVMLREISMAYLSTHVNMESMSADGQRKTFFDGNTDKLDFTTLSHRRLMRNVPESDQAEIGYSLGRHDDFPGEEVLIRREKIPLDGSPGRGGNEMVLCSGVKEFEISYWDARQEEWGSDWVVEFEDLIDPEVALQTDEGEQDKMDWLPYRVKVRLVLEKPGNGDLVLESQTPIYMRRAFRFHGVAGQVRSRTRSSGGGIVRPSSPLGRRP